MVHSPCPRPRRWLVQVCQHRSCQHNGSVAVLQAFQRHQSSQILVAATGCLGQCSSGPTVRIMGDDTWYCQVTPEDVPLIVTQHLDQGKRVRSRLHPRFHPLDCSPET